MITKNSRLQNEGLKSAVKGMGRDIAAFSECKKVDCKDKKGHAKQLCIADCVQKKAAGSIDT